MLILKVGVRYPIAGYATLADNRIQLKGVWGVSMGKRSSKHKWRVMPAEAEHLGVVLAQELLAQGAGGFTSKPFIT